MSLLDQLAESFGYSNNMSEESMYQKLHNNHYKDKSLTDNDYSHRNRSSKAADAMSTINRKGKPDIKSGSLYYPPSRSANASQRGLVEGSVSNYVKEQQTNASISGM